MKFHILLLAYVIIPLFSVHSEKYYKASPFITSKHSKFGHYIEGVSVNKTGEIFATNFGGEIFQIGHITPHQSLYHASPRNTSHFNGIRFLPLHDDEINAGIKNIALAANIDENEITKITEMNDGTTKQETFCKDDSFVKPNDLTLSKTGRIYISGEDYVRDNKVGDGGLWLCQPDGKAIQLETFGRTNGIELAPDEKTLYLSESFNKGFKVISNKIWKFKVDPKTGLTSPKELFVDFKELDGTQAIDIDGMRTDIKGNLYVTRNGGQEIVVFSPNKKVLFRIKLNILHPTNLEFGGKDGRTLYIAGRCSNNYYRGCVDKFENHLPGKAFTFLNLYKSLRPYAIRHY